MVYRNDVIERLSSVGAKKRSYWLRSHFSLFSDAVESVPGFRDAMNRYLDILEKERITPYQTDDKEFFMRTFEQVPGLSKTVGILTRPYFTQHRKRSLE